MSWMRGWRRAAPRGRPTLRRGPARRRSIAAIASAFWLQSASSLPACACSRRSETEKKRKEEEKEKKKASSDGEPRAVCCFCCCLFCFFPQLQPPWRHDERRREGEEEEQRSRPMPVTASRPIGERCASRFCIPIWASVSRRRIGQQRSDCSRIVDRRWACPLTHSLIRRSCRTRNCTLN